MRKAVMFVLLLFLVLNCISADAETIIDYNFVKDENYSMTLMVFTKKDTNCLDCNFPVYSNVDTLEVTIDNRMFLKGDFLNTRVGTYELELENDFLVDANVLTILADDNQLSTKLSFEPVHQGATLHVVDANSGYRSKGSLFTEYIYSMLPFQSIRIDFNSFSAWVSSRVEVASFSVPMGLIVSLAAICVLAVIVDTIAYH